MRTSQAVSYAVLLLLLTSCSSSHASVLEDTCKNFGDYDECMKFFQADKDSATADERGLAVIAIKIARAVAVSTLERIDVIKETDKDKRTQGPLATCYAVYSGSVTSFDKATKDIAAEKLQDALVSLGYTAPIANTCEEEFRSAGVKSPLADEDSKFPKVTAFPYGMTGRLMSPKV